MVDEQSFQLMLALYVYFFVLSSQNRILSALTILELVFLLAENYISEWFW